MKDRNKMKIAEIYQKYKVPPNLQEHMLRVAAMAEIIANSWPNNSLDREILLLACLTHDMGNILKFDLVNKINFLGEEAKMLYIGGKLRRKWR